MSRTINICCDYYFLDTKRLFVCTWVITIAAPQLHSSMDGRWIIVDGWIYQLIVGEEKDCLIVDGWIIDILIHGTWMVRYTEGGWIQRCIDEGRTDRWMCGGLIKNVTVYDGWID